MTTTDTADPAIDLELNRMAAMLLLIDPNWTPDQAMAVINLLDDLRDRIWSHYKIVLQQKLRDERLTHYNVVISDPPF